MLLPGLGVNSTLLQHLCTPRSNWTPQPLLTTNMQLTARVSQFRQATPSNLPKYLVSRCWWPLGYGCTPAPRITCPLQSPHFHLKLAYSSPLLSPTSDLPEFPLPLLAVVILYRRFFSISLIQTLTKPASQAAKTIQVSCDSMIGYKIEALKL